MSNEVTKDGLNEHNHDESRREKKRPTISPHDNDVVSGRGSGANRHVGNAKFRELVRDNKALYMRLTKHEKMSVARTILSTVSSRDPPGRFLQKNPETFQWFEIGQTRALEKISQALREKTHQPVQDKLPQCQTSRPQDSWRDGAYQRSTQDAAMLPLHLRNDGHRPASNSIENQLNNSPSSAKEISRFNCGMAFLKDQRNNLRQQRLHKLAPMRERPNSSNRDYCDTRQYHYNHDSPISEAGVFESMVPLKMPPSIYNREQSFSTTYPSQVQGDRMSSKFTSGTDSISAHPSLGRRRAWPTSKPRVRNDASWCPQFQPLPQPPLPPKASGFVFTKNHTQALHVRESWNSNSTFTGHTTMLPSNSVQFVQNRTPPALRMHLPALPTLNYNPLNPQRRKSPSHFNNLETHNHQREVQYTNQMNVRKRQKDSLTTKENKRLCINSAEVENHNVVSSESNDEETVSTQAPNTYSNSSSKTSSPSSISEATEGGSSKEMCNAFQASGLLALSTAAFMHAQEKGTSPS